MRADAKALSQTLRAFAAATPRPLITAPQAVAFSELLRPQLSTKVNDDHIPQLLCAIAKAFAAAEARRNGQ